MQICGMNRRGGTSCPISTALKEQGTNQEKIVRKGEKKKMAKSKGKVSSSVKKRRRGNGKKGIGTIFGCDKNDCLRGHSKNIKNGA